MNTSTNDFLITNIIPFPLIKYYYRIVIFYNYFCNN